ncbi:unnamed protein product, partial [Didymodactylos carnosus]
VKKFNITQGDEPGTSMISTTSIINTQSVILSPTSPTSTMEATRSPNSSKRSALNSIESNETQVKLKKLKQDLLIKFSKQLQPKDKKLENQIERYLALNVETNDVLQWWNA